ncbi:MAG: 4Fe-4S binding protein [Clostridia bacterium]|nr:4Fe-4S binding protein [Clostridia bacterium]
MKNVYERLADALNTLPNGFPRTETGSDIRLLEFMYSPVEAALACELTNEPETVSEIAERLNKISKEVMAGLLHLSKEGKVWMDMSDGKPKFRLAPFIVGSYEAHVDHMNAEMALLFEEYLNDGGVKGIMGVSPSVHRVIPTIDHSELEWILPYDSVIKILEQANTFHVQDCICRLQQESIGKGCDAPKHNCLSFSAAKRKPIEGDITKEEALEIIKEAEQAGLVHSVSNVVNGLHYICNCCGCCCGILRSINEWGIENSMARANYEAIVDDDKCIGCEVCVDRCQVSAIEMAEGLAKINRDKCLGCGLCISTCPSEAIALFARPAEEQVTPPEDFGQWEKQRLEKRNI